ncbi:hypothetical protein FA95DRAFT_1559979 [Auriscalpium vulgare]|uniref:Uncharacterized protein n=1 Tax=Auriscalpium vulgare TaxID=40419 RepID=A0ACB8RR76_9AGAM|nr:hypothetical protein FA95DRAFT_1559979 [Auriscalpium vulgare]
MQVQTPFDKRTALEINFAIRAVSSKVRPIGRCVTKERVGRQGLIRELGGDHWSLKEEKEEDDEDAEEDEEDDEDDEDEGDEDEVEEKVEEDDDDEDGVMEEKLEEEDDDEEKVEEDDDEEEDDEEEEDEEDVDEVVVVNANPSSENIVRQLTELYKQSPVHASGSLAEPFHLKVTRKGCKWDVDIQPQNAYVDRNSKAENPLRKLFNNAAISGYGDVLSQKTKVDAHVRDARDIPASEFSVSQSLLDTVSQLWSKNFGQEDVKAEPYKIHLYGPDGHFEAHRDTPETDLVGTFLVGIGDSTGNKHLELGLGATDWYRRGGTSDELPSYAANPGQWVAFYPDVPHRVTRIWQGYRAVIAFKVFRQAASLAAATPASVLPAAAAAAPTAEPGNLAATKSGELERVKAVTDKLTAPFGLLLERKYCMGTERLNGLDAVVYEALATRDGHSAHLLPVVIKWSAEVYKNYEEGGFDMQTYTALVYPFTAAHVDAISRADTSFGKIGKVDDPAASDESLAWPPSTFEWSHKHEDPVAHTGNESRPYSEDSIYLSYAVVLLADK